MLRWLPNAISAVRLVGGPALAYYLMAGSGANPLKFAETLVGLFLVLVATDWLDGFLARRLNARTRFGAFLDPLADKALVWSFFGVFAVHTDLLDAWAVVALLVLALFDAYSTLRRLVQWNAPVEHLRANGAGKWKTFFSYFAILCLLGAVGVVAFLAELESGTITPAIAVNAMFTFAFAVHSAEIAIVTAAFFALISVLRTGLRRIQTQS